MTGDDLWLGSRIPALLQAIRSAGLHIRTFRASPESFGSWYVDVGRWLRRYRVIADGKESWIVVQSSTLFGDWKDLRTFRSIHGPAWIDQVIETLKKR